jgi:putative ABC transport system substrate-binding protein
MRRRYFLTLVGGAAAWPLAAGAQQRERMRRIGVISPVNDQPTQARYAAFIQGLQQLGWTVGRNVHIDARWAEGNAAEIRRHAAELAALAPDVIFATGSAGTGPMLEATRTVPIVFAIAPDPVGSGYVKSLSQPGGNATGFMMFEYSLCGKWLELLKEIAPRIVGLSRGWQNRGDCSSGRDDSGSTSDSLFRRVAVSQLEPSRDKTMRRAIRATGAKPFFLPPS